MKAKGESEVAQSCPTLSDPMDCSLPGSSVHGIFQARALEWGAIVKVMTRDPQPQLPTVQFWVPLRNILGLPHWLSIKNLLVMQEAWVKSLDQEDALEEDMATHSRRILAWRIPWTEEPGRLQSIGFQGIRHD